MIYIIAGLAILVILDKLVYNGPIKGGGCMLLFILFTIYFVHGCLREQKKTEEQNQRYEKAIEAMREERLKYQKYIH